MADGIVVLYTLGQSRPGGVEEWLAPQGVVTGIERTEQGGVRLVLEPTFSTQGIIRDLPVIRQFCNLAYWATKWAPFAPPTYKLPKDGGSFTPELFHPGLERAMAMADRGFDMRLTYIGNPKGETYDITTQLAEELRLVKVEKDTYKLGLFKAAKLLGNVAGELRGADKETAEYLSNLMKKLRVQEDREGKSKRDKAFEKEMAEKGIPRILQRGVSVEEGLGEGSGELASAIGKARGEE